VRCLITGSSGYLGSALVTKLLEIPEIDKIYGFDACFFGQNVVDDSGKYTLINERVDDISLSWGEWLEDLEPDVVISLAALSNDPACELNPSLTKIINHFSVVAMAYECYKKKIPLIFASSASVYGAVNYACSEWSPTFPISLYASEKLGTERDLWAMADDSWQPRIFRMATLYGPSARFRLDLAINKMVFDALTIEKITVHGGEQYRPFLYIDNAVWFYVTEIRMLIEQTEGPFRKMGSIRNLCDFNSTIGSLAKIIGDYFDAEVVVESQNLDSRNYRMLPAFEDMVWDADERAKYFCEKLDKIKDCVNKIENSNDTRYYTVRRIREVL